MEDVSVAHAKEHLEELIARAAAGEDVRIVDPQLGTVKLLQIKSGAGQPTYPPRRLGLRSDLAEIPDERLFAPLTDDELAWLSGEQSKVE